jgi:hypothetical protein
MNLTEQQKQIGKENFDEAVAITRRDFLAGTVAAGVATGAGLGSIYFGYGKSVGDPLRVGFLGTGDEIHVPGLACERQGQDIEHRDEPLCIKQVQRRRQCPAAGLHDHGQNRARRLERIAAGDVHLHPFQMLGDLLADGHRL